jgi:hypothetical protein
MVRGTEVRPAAIPVASGYPPCCLFLLFLSFGVAVTYIFIHTHIYILHIYI